MKRTAVIDYIDISLRRNLVALYTFKTTSDYNMEFYKREDFHIEVYRKYIIKLGYNTRKINIQKL